MVHPCVYLGRLKKTKTPLSIMEQQGSLEGLGAFLNLVKGMRWDQGCGTADLFSYPITFWL